MVKNNKTTKIGINFGLRIRQLRSERGWSQEKFAEKTNLHRTYIGAIERGEQNVSLNNIDKLARALKVKLSFLFENL